MATTLDDVRQQHEATRLQLETAAMQREIAVLESARNILAAPVTEAFGDVVDRREYLHDGGPAWEGNRGRRYTQAHDRQYGANYPHWETEYDLAEIRGIGRFVAATDEVGISALENLTNYILDDGFTYTAIARDEKATDVKLVAAVQWIIDEFIEANDWGSGYQSTSDSVEVDLEREIIQDSRIDGEKFLALVDAGGGHVLTEPIEPDHVTEPDRIASLEDYLYESGQIDSVGLDWKFGVAKYPNCPARKVGYFVEKFGDQNDWEFIPNSRMIHVRINAGRNVCRGMSDYYAVYRDLERAAKLLGNTLQGAAIQASIAYIKEHAAGTSKSSIEAANSGIVNLTRRVGQEGGGYRELNVSRILPGRIIDTVGTKYHAGPLGSTNGPSYVDIVQAAYRVIGCRWTMPEYMISGDASNANFASTMVAESPFVKAASSKQAFYRRAFGNAIWKVLNIAIAAGRLRRFGIERVSELRRIVEIDVKGPDIAVRDRLQDHQIRQEEHEAGILSLTTWAEEAGRDYQQEVRLGAKRVVQPSLIQPPVNPANPADRQPTLESIRSLIWEGYP